jgi:hypothetical protein
VKNTFPIKKQYFQTKGPCQGCALCFPYNGLEIGFVEGRGFGIPKPPLHENCMCVVVEMTEAQAKGLTTHECACGHVSFWTSHGKVVTCSDCGRNYIGHQTMLKLCMYDVTEYNEHRGEQLL